MYTTYCKTCSINWRSIFSLACRNVGKPYRFLIILFQAEDLNTLIGNAFRLAYAVQIQEEKERRQKQEEEQQQHRQEENLSNTSSSPAGSGKRQQHHRPLMSGSRSVESLLATSSSQQQQQQQQQQEEPIYELTTSSGDEFVMFSNGGGAFVRGDYGRMSAVDASTMARLHQAQQQQQQQQAHMQHQQQVGGGGGMLTRVSRRSCFFLVFLLFYQCQKMSINCVGPTAPICSPLLLCGCHLYSTGRPRPSQRGRGSLGQPQSSPPDRDGSAALGPVHSYHGA